MPMQHYKLNDMPLGELVRKVAECLDQDGLVIFPSDTVYGALVKSNSIVAVDRLISFKERPPGKPISVFVSGFDMMKDIVELDAAAEQKIKPFLPGSYTVVLPAKHVLDSRLESETGTLGVRYITFEPVVELMKTVSYPVTATSANLAGKGPHYSVDALLKTLPNSKKDAISMIVDAGPLPRNKPSTVVDLSTDSVKVLRLGDRGIPAKEYQTRSSEETQQKAEEILTSVLSTSKARRIVFLLKGDLGAGKTQFVKGVGSALAVEEDIISPTFVIWYEYKTKDQRIPLLYHFDLYNIESEEEFQHLGIEEIAEKPGVLCIEWGERMGNQYDLFTKNAETYLVEITGSGEDPRSIRVEKL